MLFFFPAPATALALAFQIQCDNGSLRSIAPQGDPTTCAGYEALGLKCGDTATKNSDPRLLTLRTPFDSNYANRNSKTYRRDLIRALVRDAVRADSDPYLLLALIMVEAPPINREALLYLDSYGTPPLDSIGAISAMNCGSREFEDRRQMIVPEAALPGLIGRRGREIKVLKHVGVDDPDYKLASTSGGETATTSEFVPANSAIVESSTKNMHAVSAGKPLKLTQTDTSEGEDVVVETSNLDVSGWPRLWVSKAKRVEDCGRKCCLGVRVAKGAEIQDGGTRDKDGKYGVSDSLRARLLRDLGLRFIDGMMERDAKFGFVKSGATPEERFALTVQGYNGYGIFGVGEPVKNPCLHGIDMKSKPVYGAGVGELMLNAVMGNSEVRAMVAEAEAETGHRARSHYCSGRGAASFSVGADEFTRLQARYLAGRNCKRTFAMLRKETLPEVQTADLPTEAVQ